MAVAAPFIMIGLTAIGTAASVVGSIQQGQQQAQMAQAQADQARMQGELANLQARSQAAEMLNEQNRLRAKQFTQASAAGVSLDSQSFMAVVASEASRAERDRQQVLRTGQLNQAAGLASASAYESQGSFSKWAGWFNAGTSLIKGTTAGMGIADKAGWFE